MFKLKCVAKQVSIQALENRSMHEMQDMLHELSG